MKIHDLSDGIQSCCQICGNKDLKQVIDLGTQPLSDKLQRMDRELKEEISFPLVQLWCSVCGLNQLNFICPSEIMFGDDYSYKTGVTQELVTYQAQMAADLVELLSLKDEDLVCDLGSNDGTLLKGFMKQGVNVIGVEPTDIADLANKDGVPTLRMPFGEVAAKSVIEKSGKVSLATATNVFAHIENFFQFPTGIGKRRSNNSRKLQVLLLLNLGDGCLYDGCSRIGEVNNDTVLLLRNVDGFCHWPVRRG